MKKKLDEPSKVTRARHLRAGRLSEAMLEWHRLSEQRQYPRSLHAICMIALKHEYVLGRAAARKAKGGGIR